VIDEGNLNQWDIDVVSSYTRNLRLAHSASTTPRSS